MSGATLPDLNTAGAFSGSEEFYLVQGGQDAKVSSTALAAALQGLAPATLLSVKVSLSSSQILNATTSPVTVIPAPGAGKVVVIIQSVYSYIFGTTPYSGGPVGLYYGTTPNQADYGQLFFFALSASSFGLVGQGGNQSDLISQYENQPILFTGTGPYTGGDGTGAVTVWYVIASVP
jgi:hypothetical protein